MDLLAAAGNVFVLITRYALPVICLLMLLSLIKKMFYIGRKTVVGKLVMPNNTEFEITAAENIVGRSKICDIRLNIPTISRRHAVLSYSRDYGFKICCVRDSKILVNDIEIDKYAYLQFGDVVEIGGAQFELLGERFEDISSDSKSKPKHKNGGFFAALMLTLFQLMVCMQLVIHYSGTEHVLPTAFTFGLLIAGEWVYFIFRRIRGIQIEIIGFFLTSIGLAVAASATPDSLYKQLLSAVLGAAFFIAMRFVYKSVDLVMKLRYFAAGAAVLLFAYNIFFGVVINGARNWIKIGGATLQPSELVKFLFIFAGAATLERLLTFRNLTLFLGFSAVVLGSLAYMRDFGTAAIFFATMLIILYMRSGDIKIITLITGAALAAGLLVIKFVPYVTDRFSAYRHAWDYAASSGYQQTRTMMAIGSGGLFGLGGGEGNLDRVAAADTDLVFGIICEEWGAITALCAVACIVLTAIYSLRCTPRTDSAFFAISACSAAGLFIVQSALNIFGSTDLLPLTGVTLPFISNGGTSMLASWMLLSFIKAVGENTLKA